MDKVEFGDMPPQAFLLGLLSAFDNRYQAAADKYFRMIRCAPKQDKCVNQNLVNLYSMQYDSIVWNRFFTIISIMS